MSDWNDQIIAEFRANDGKVGGQFEGAPMVLLHHKGRKSGTERVAPLMYLPGDDSTIYVFASKAGAPTNPDWYYNVIDARQTDVEVGTEKYPVRVEELEGHERDRVFGEQVSRYAGFGEYAEKTKGIRAIPVLALHRG